MYALSRDPDEEKSHGVDAMLCLWIVSKCDSPRRVFTLSIRYLLACHCHLEVSLF